MYLFKRRHLIDFSIEEIARLVRALFADSPARAENLEYIMRGHPPEGEGDSGSGSDSE